LSEGRCSVLSYSQRLAEATGGEAALCLGIDPSSEQLAQWGLEDSALGLEQFALACVEAAAEQIKIIKVQVAFFERFASAGYLALETTLQAAREAGLFVIADAKRGDIGSTMQGYAGAWLADGSALAADALTVSPYLGFDSLLPTIDFARKNSRGLFVLAATSNPEGHQSQLAETGGVSLAAEIVASAQRLQDQSVGCVVGATVDLGRYGLESLTSEDCVVPLLVPGYGAQGASLESVKEFGASAHRVIANVSRAITGAGPQGVSAQLESARSLL
jgi:orotidine-5'-phosphate decarboxylase